MKVQEISSSESANIFTGNIYIFYAFDIGDDIDIEAIEKMRSVIKAPQRIPKYFKNYHVPLAISLPIDHISPRCISSKIHNFGVISLIYKIPFTTTLKELHATFGNIAESFIAQSDDDARVIYKKIEGTVTHPNFSNMSTWYAIIQTNPQPHIKEPKEIQKSHADTIASLLRFETETLSEHQINDIWNSAIGYFHGDLIIIDTDAAFIYDDEYEELLDLFEFANIQRLELCYFDRMLDTNLKAIYEGKVKQFPTHAYLHLISLFLD